MNQRIKASVTVNITKQFMVQAPPEVVRRHAAKHAGDLLTELLLNPNANPFDGLQLAAEQREDFYRDLTMLHVSLSCERMPVQYPALTERGHYGPVPIEPPEPAHLHFTVPAIDK